MAATYNQINPVTPAPTKQPAPQPLNMNAVRANLLRKQKARR